MRQSIVSEDIFKRMSVNPLKLQLRSMSARSEQSRRSRESVADFGSDTESHGANNEEDEDEEEEEEALVMQPSQSVPDLSARSRAMRSRSNIDFGKLTRSPRQFCPCQLPLDDNEILTNYMQRY